jgi:hypothetical protein
MSSRNMRLLPRATLHSDSEQYLRIDYYSTYLLFKKAEARIK